MCLRIASILLLAAASGACASAPSSSSSPILFHLALMPVEVAPREVDPGAGDADVPISITSELITGEFARELSHSGFERVTTLSMPRDPEPTLLQGLGLPADPSTWNRSQRLSWFAAESERIDADLLLSCEATFDAIVDNRSNSVTIPNYFIFFFLGPLCYISNDNSYDVRSSAKLDFYDVRVLRETLAEASASELSTEDLSRARLDNKFAAYDTVSLDFIDRASGKPYLYAVSILVPTPLLAKQTKEVSRIVSEETALGLAERASAIIASESDSLVRPSLADFYIEQDHVKVWRDAQGQVRVEGSFMNSERSTAERLTQVTLKLGASSLTVALDKREPLAGGGQVRYPFQATLPQSPTASDLQFIVERGGATLRTKQYTRRTDSLGESRP